MVSRDAQGLAPIVVPVGVRPTGIVCVILPEKDLDNLRVWLTVRRSVHCQRYRLGAEVVEVRGHPCERGRWAQAGPGMWIACHTRRPRSPNRTHVRDRPAELARIRHTGCDARHGYGWTGGRAIGPLVGCVGSRRRCRITVRCRDFQPHRFGRFCHRVAYRANFAVLGRDDERNAIGSQQVGRDGGDGALAARRGGLIFGVRWLRRTVRLGYDPLGFGRATGDFHTVVANVATVETDLRGVERERDRIADATRFRRDRIRLVQDNKRARVETLVTDVDAAGAVLATEKIGCADRIVDARSVGARIDGTQIVVVTIHANARIAAHGVARVGIAAAGIWIVAARIRTIAAGNHTAVVFAFSIT